MLVTMVMRTPAHPCATMRRTMVVRTAPHHGHAHPCAPLITHSPDICFAILFGEFFEGCFPFCLGFFAFSKGCTDGL